MNPSKENADKAIEAFQRLESKFIPCYNYNDDDVLFVTSFITAAKKRLPREETLAKDKGRNRKKKTKFVQNEAVPTE